MRNYYLAKNAFMCEASGYVIFLDLARDRYMALPPESARTLLPLQSDFMTSWDDHETQAVSNAAPSEEFLALVQNLESEGVFVSEELHGKCFSPLQLDRPRDSLRVYEKQQSEIPPEYRLRFLIARTIAVVMLRFLPLKSVVARVQARRLREASRNTFAAHDDLSRLAAICSALQPRNFSGDDACLRNSLTLVEFLAQFRIFPDWVFGVRIPPFAAHSWVQYKTTVLNDSVYHVETFVPLMVV